MLLNGETVIMPFKGNFGRKSAVGLNIGDSEKQLDPWAHLPPPWVNIHVDVYYMYHNIQTSSLKPLGQSKLDFM